jgi:uncharacterized membrane protein
MMKTKLFNIWDSVRTSFWFIPTLMVCSAIGLSFVMIALDRKVDLDADGFFSFVYTGSPDGARSVLSTIAGSMMTVAGVAFSITIVALTLASSQFGPRLLRNFMQDTGNQFVLGTFIATFIYCLLVLRTVHSAEGQLFVPNISVTFAVVLALANVGVLIYFIHHVSISIQANHVIRAAHDELMEDMKRLFPEESGCEFGKSENDGFEPKPEENRYHHADAITASRNGYLQAIDSDGLLEITRKHDCLVCLHVRPGDFIVTGGALATIQSVERLDQELIRKIPHSFIVGSQRTPEQDPEFGIEQLVEVAVRALSPGINDPFTAMACIDRLGSTLCYLANRKFPPSCRYDSEANLRLIIANPVTFAGITNTAFDQIRQYGRSSVAVTIRLLETLQTIAAQTRCPDRQQVLLRQADMVERASHESISEDNDRADVHQCYLAVLNEKRY